MASALQEFLAQVRRQGRAPGPMAGHSGSTALADAVFGMKPEGTFGGADDGRPIMASGGGSLGGASPLRLAMRGAGTFEATPRRTARAKDPVALDRRRRRIAALQAAGAPSTDIRDLGDEQVDFLRAGGLVGGTPDFDDDRPSIGSQLANIRWHGNPDGPREAEDLLADVNALRAAARRPRASRS
jgi:hypothetical protein